MSEYSADTIVRVARVAGESIIVGGDLSADSIVRFVQSTSAPVTSVLTIRDFATLTVQVRAVPPTGT